MQTRHEPEIPTPKESCAQQKSGFDRDGCGAKQSRVRVGQVDACRYGGGPMEGISAESHDDQDADSDKQDAGSDAHAVTQTIPLISDIDTTKAIPVEPIMGRSRPLHKTGRTKPIGIHTNGC